MMTTLLSYGTYVPHHRLSRATIAATLGAGSGGGSRAVAAFDEDTTSMGVEAGRQALRGTDVRPLATYFATTAPAYLDKTNACVVHAALGLDGTAFAMDVNGAVRSGVGALLAAADASRPTLAVLSDVRTGRPGSADERDGGDGAAAFVFGAGRGVAEVVSVASATEEFLDRWRLPGALSSRVWEERFGEAVYVPLAHAALADALKQAGVAQQDVAHAAVSGTHRRAVQRFAREAGFAPQAFTEDLLDSIGHTGTAHVGMQLAALLDRAEPDDLVAVTVLADGATTIVLRALAGVTRRRADPVAAQVARGDDRLAYPTFLTWRGFLDREPPRRPDPDAPASPPAQRNERWKYRLVGAACGACGTRHLPPVRACVRCGVVDQMSDVEMADTPATVTTFTVDRLAFTPSPPMIGVVLDFDGGGRLRCQLADAGEDDVAVGDRVEMTFRRLSTARGIHNYFWKARPMRSGAGET